MDKPVFLHPNILNSESQSKQQTNFIDTAGDTIVW